ncbi:hypothetical protein ABH924_001755 [Arthrobacter sp. GAS37]
MRHSAWLRGAFLYVGHLLYIVHFGELFASMLP